MFLNIIDSKIALFTKKQVISLLFPIFVKERIQYNHNLPHHFQKDIYITICCPISCNTASTQTKHVFPSFSPYPHLQHTHYTSWHHLHYSSLYSTSYDNPIIHQKNEQTNETSPFLFYNRA